jgi:hypothetical protein
LTPAGDLVFERIRQLARRGKPLGGVFGQRTHHDPLEAFRNARRALAPLVSGGVAQRRRRLVGMLVQKRHRRIGLEGQFPGQHLVEHHASE